ncbi:hypothetical protein [Amaricoccus sp.]|uniref:hypothetical protein n=1 Tax=Amaricoccus sp. TaxID=1872485 RepID=UPI001B4410F4|nr:hypothetical protein [Amaricoccus sp.]MBP7241820.1 hypothetical protein [Amaricoccus sp.]
MHGRQEGLRRGSIVSGRPSLDGPGTAAALGSDSIANVRAVRATAAAPVIGLATR